MLIRFLRWLTGKCQKDGTPRKVYLHIPPMMDAFTYDQGIDHLACPQCESHKFKK